MSETAPQKRYDRLWKAIHTGLERNRTMINLRDAVARAYGKDISIFAGGGETTATAAQPVIDSSGSSQHDAAIDLLAKLLDDVLEGANDRIREEIETLLQTHKVPEQLTLLDEILQEFDSEIQAARDAEYLDKVSAQEEVKRAKLPDGISVSDLLTLHAYRSRSRLYQELVQDLHAMEEENQRLIKDIEQRKQDIRLRVQKLEEQGQALENLADQCSLHGAL